MRTEHKLIQTLKNRDLLCEFEVFDIHVGVSGVQKNGRTVIGGNKNTGVLLPIAFQFRKRFEQNDLLLKALTEMGSLSKASGVRNFLQGSLWKEKSKFYQESDKIAIPFFLYIDDSEVNNPLGSHVCPITFVYYSFPGIDSSPTDLACLFEAKVYQMFGNRKCLSRLLAEIKSIEMNGIDINTSDGVKKVHFMLGLVLGDNKGLSTALGFLSLSAKYYCRFCKLPKEICQHLQEEDASQLRNRQNYEIDMSMKDPKKTGIKEESVFHCIESFHVTTNFAVDLMHDLFEGVCHYDLCHIINYFTNVKKYFSLARLNLRKQMFDYGPIEIGNKSNEIKSQHIDDSRLKMSASEMICFVSFLSLMIGDLVPRNDEVWIFFLNFLQLIELLLRFQTSNETAARVKSLVREHHLDYCRLFKDTLKPKHHHMLHFDSVMIQSGPPRTHWSFPFEMQHKDHKSYARSITSRKNACVSIAKKFQFEFAHSLQSTESWRVIFKDSHRKNRSQHENFINNFRRDLQEPSNFCVYSACKYYGRRYKFGFHLAISPPNIDVCERIELFEIEEIVKFESLELPYVLCKYVPTEMYNEHLAAYEVRKLNSNQDVEHNLHLTEFSLLAIDCFCGPPFDTHKMPDAKTFVRVKLH